MFDQSRPVARNQEISIISDACYWTLEEAEFLTYCPLGHIEALTFFFPEVTRLIHQLARDWGICMMCIVDWFNMIDVCMLYV